MNDVERAISQIADIRAQLAASTHFRGIAPKGSALIGAFACLVATAQTLWPDALAQDYQRYIAVWAVFTIASTVTAAIEGVSLSRSVNWALTDPLLCAALRQILPFAAAGVVITAAVCKFSPASAWLLPGLWQILVGLTGFATSSSLPRGIVWAAGWYFLCGSIVLALAGAGGSLSPWMMGFPFAVGQSIVAFVLYSSGEHDGPA